MTSRFLGWRTVCLASLLSISYSALELVWGQTTQDLKATAAKQADDASVAVRQLPLAPAVSLAQIELASGLTARLLAHEPQVVDPVEVTFDDAGRMWVVQMLDYPFRTSEQPRGRISILSDSDDDGHFETAQVFADQLEMPTGLALWKNGAVVTVAGQLIYLTDNDGDLRADQTQVWLEGFAQENEQLRANHPRLGPDGWWYIACGLRGGKVQLGSDLRGDRPAEPLEIGSRDVRFHLATKTIELVTGPAQFGLTFDTVGHRLFCSNRNPATQVVFEQADLEGNPLAGLLPSIVDVVPAGEQSRVYPLVDAWVTSHLHSGQFTAACGVFAHGLDDGRTDIFTCEPTGSLVHRQRSQRSGGTLVPSIVDRSSVVDRSADQESSSHPTSLPPTSPASTSIPSPSNHEFLASRDAWFRPVNVTLAPDGALIVVDMHRAVIEHPAWVPEELKQRPDERWGDQAGRVLWVGPDAQRTAVWSELRAQPLSSRTDQALAALIANDNPWLRQTAERLLLERQASGTLDSLQALVADSSQSDGVRISALQLCVLIPQEGSKSNVKEQLTKLIASGIADQPHSDLAVFALRASRWLEQPTAERRATLPSTVNMDELLRLAVHAADSGVRFEAWLSLARVSTAESRATGAEQGASDWRADPATAAAVAQRWIEDGDGYMLMAAASGLRAQPDLLLLSLLSELPLAQKLSSSAGEQVAQVADSLMLAAMRQSLDIRELSRLAQSLISNVTGTDLTAANLQASNSPGREAARLAALHVLQQLAKNGDTKQQLDAGLWQQLAALAEDARAAMSQRTVAAELLAYAPGEGTAALLQQLVQRQTEPELSEPLIRAWCAVGGDAPNQYLLELLPSASPRLQRTILPLIASSPARLALLAEQLDAGGITAGQLGASELSKLVESASGQTKSQLQTHLAGIVNSDRSQVVERYKDCLALESDVGRGMELFRKHCASCHRVGEIGVDVGPNISDSRTKLPLELLTAILDPNRAIDNNYFRFIVLTEEGRVIEGIIAEETGEALIIRGQDDRRELIRRDDIATMKATGVSLMPEGLEAQLDPQSMADLIAFIKGWRYIDGAIPVQQ